MLNELKICQLSHAPCIKSPMPLLYRDSFQDDEQVINLLASMRVLNPLAAQPAAQPGPHMPHHGRPRPRVVDVSDDSDTNDNSNAAGPNVVRDRSAAAPVRGVVRPLIGRPSRLNANPPGKYSFNT